jgi:nicotinamidase-related amidase
MSRRLSEMAEVALPIRPAVLLIDMQTLFVRDLRKSLLKRLIIEQKKVVSLCVELGIPLIVLEYSGYGKTVPALVKAFEGIKSAHLLFKSGANGFYSTSLEYLLGSLLVNTVVPIGVNASGCVFSTAREAFNLGYDVLTAKPLMADGRLVFTTAERRKRRGRVIRWWREKQLRYKTTEELIRALRRELGKTVR